MYDEKDHDTKGLTLGARVAWVAVAFVFLFMVLPALAPVRPTTMSEPAKTTYTGPLSCFPDTQGEPVRPVLVCDRPESSLTRPGK